MVMENKPYLLFRPKRDSKDYVILVFWATNYDDTRCNIQENAEVIEKEVLAEGFQLQFKVENIPSSRWFISYAKQLLHLGGLKQRKLSSPTTGSQAVEVFHDSLGWSTTLPHQRSKNWSKPHLLWFLNSYKQQLKVWRIICYETCTFFWLCDCSRTVRIWRLPRSSTKQLGACRLKSPTFSPTNCFMWKSIAYCLEPVNRIKIKRLFSLWMYCNKTQAKKPFNVCLI